MMIGNVYREIVQSPKDLTKRSICTYKERCYFDRERLEYRMMIGNVYMEIVQSLNDLTKR